MSSLSGETSGATTRRRTARRDRLVGAASLFVSTGTLVCCALPALLVLLGFGATVASAISSLPFLVPLSRHKAWVFGFAGACIAAGFAYRRWLASRQAGGAASCPPDDPRCATLDRLGGVLLSVSAGLYLVGLTTAYVLPWILRALDS